jgi:hypothetical protein
MHKGIADRCSPEKVVPKSREAMKAGESREAPGTTECPPKHKGNLNFGAMLIIDAMLLLMYLLC